jgi:hypothetical protein
MDVEILTPEPEQQEWDLGNVAKVLAVDVPLFAVVYIAVPSPYYVLVWFVVAILWGIISGFFWPVRPTRDE